MDNATKMVVECDVSKRVVKVDRATFEKRINQFHGDVVSKRTSFIKHIFSSTGEYIASCTNILYTKDTDPVDYYIPVGDAYE